MYNLIEIIKKNLTIDLLKPEYKNNHDNYLFGHCYVATETYYHLLDEFIQIEFKPHILKINSKTHWFLKNIKTGEIIDITRGQFNYDLNYDNAKQHAFLTKTPSKRSLILINRVYEEINS